MPAATLQAKGLPYTLSHDAPITPVPWILPLVDASVNRISKSGALIGAAERVSAYDALRAVTSTAAYQIKEERTKGTLEVGKLADLVILERNPLKVDSKAIKDIRVLETIKEGVSIFSASSAGSAVQTAFVPHDCVHGDVGSAPLSPSSQETLALLLNAHSS
jgi:hypothetical protein